MADPGHLLSEAALGLREAENFSDNSSAIEVGALTRTTMRKETLCFRLSPGLWWTAVYLTAGFEKSKNVAANQGIVV